MSDEHKPQDQEALRWYRLYHELLAHLGPDIPAAQRHEAARGHIRTGEAVRTGQVQKGGR